MTFATKTLTALRRCAAAAAVLTMLAASHAQADGLLFAPKPGNEMGQLFETSRTKGVSRAAITTTAPLAGDKGTCLHYAKGGVPIYRINIIKRSCKASLDVKRLTPAWVIGTKTLATMQTIYDMGKG